LRDRGSNFERFRYAAAASENTHPCSNTRRAAAPGADLWSPCRRGGLRTDWAPAASWGCRRPPTLGGIGAAALDCSASHGQRCRKPSRPR
jgi:hypothetical protein